MTSQMSLFDQETQKTPSGDDALKLAQFAEQAYLDYAISVVKGRALPDVCDGQKPVQRRILYAMDLLNLNNQAKPRKSAAVVGDVLGKLHPHGDQSVYDALVRMAQPFTLRYPLIDGHGNFGSRDGDSAAAMRYTEARLTPIAQLLLSEIDSGTVTFLDNYDGTAKEPFQLPARLPFTLLNGSSGIAVGMATEIPPHNLTEVSNALIALIKNPKLSLSELTQILPGPDFAGGGQIISSAQTMTDIYNTGRGSIKVRALWHIEELARGQWQAVITQLPPGTSTQKVLEEIDELTNPKIKAGKKSLSSEQNALKQEFLGLIDTVRDESSRQSPVRIVIEPRSRRIDQDTFMQHLLAHTSLESNASINLVMIGIDGKPRQKSLLQILTEWIAFRFDTVKKRTDWRLNKINERLHILDGRMIVLLNINEVIKIIQQSDDPKQKLMERFKLTPVQADDILDIRLRQLARLEKIKIETEISALNDERKTCETLLSSPAAMRRLIIREIEADTKQYGDKRRTLIQEAQKAVVEQKIADDPVTVIISKNGWIRCRNGHDLDLSNLTFKPGDELEQIKQCKLTDTLLVFANTGRVYTIAIHSLPTGRGDGTHVSALIELPQNDSIAGYFIGSPSELVLLSTQSGYGFYATVADMTSRVKNGKAFISLSENENLLPPQKITETDQNIACLSETGKLLIFDKNEIRQLSGGGHGVILMGLDVNEKLISTLPISDKGFNVTCLARNQNEHTILISGETLQSHMGKRSRKGKKLNTRFTPIQLKPMVQEKNAS